MDFIPNCFIGDAGKILLPKLFEHTYGYAFDVVTEENIRDYRSWTDCDALSKAVFLAFIELEKHAENAPMYPRNVIALGRVALGAEKCVALLAAALNRVAEEAGGEAFALTQWFNTPEVGSMGAQVGTVVVHDGACYRVIATDFTSVARDSDTSAKPNAPFCADGDIVVYGGSYHECGVAVLRRI